MEILSIKLSSDQQLSSDAPFSFSFSQTSYRPYSNGMFVNDRWHGGQMGWGTDGMGTDGKAVDVTQDLSRISIH